MFNRRFDDSVRTNLFRYCVMLLLWRLCYCYDLVLFESLLKLWYTKFLCFYNFYWCAFCDVVMLWFNFNFVNKLHWNERLLFEYRNNVCFDYVILCACNLSRTVIDIVGLEFEWATINVCLYIIRCKLSLILFSYCIDCVYLVYAYSRWSSITSHVTFSSLFLICSRTISHYLVCIKH